MRLPCQHCHSGRQGHLKNTVFYSPVSLPWAQFCPRISTDGPRICRTPLDFGAHRQEIGLHASDSDRFPSWRRHCSLTWGFAPHTAVGDGDECPSPSTLSKLPPKDRPPTTGVLVQKWGSNPISFHIYFPQMPWGAFAN